MGYREDHARSTNVNKGRQRSVYVKGGAKKSNGKYSGPIHDEKQRRTVRDCSIRVTTYPGVQMTSTCFEFWGHSSVTLKTIFCKICVIDGPQVTQSFKTAIWTKLFFNPRKTWGGGECNPLPPVTMRVNKSRVIMLSEERDRYSRWHWYLALLSVDCWTESLERKMIFLKIPHFWYMGSSIRNEINSRLFCKVRQLIISQRDVENLGINALSQMKLSWGPQTDQKCGFALS